jgi:hypothetical protein
VIDVPVDVVAKAAHERTMTTAVFVLVLVSGIVTGASVGNRKSWIYLISFGVGIAGIVFAFRLGDEGMISCFMVFVFSLAFFLSWAVQRATR